MFFLVCVFWSCIFWKMFFFFFLMGAVLGDSWMLSGVFECLSGFGVFLWCVVLQWVLNMFLVCLSSFLWIIF